jgi:hypothetical protein
MPISLTASGPTSAPFEVSAGKAKNAGAAAGVKGERIEASVVAPAMRAGVRGVAGVVGVVRAAGVVGVVRAAGVVCANEIGRRGGGPG